MQKRLFVLALIVLLGSCAIGPRVIRTAWVSTFADCPTSPEYGSKVADGANLWRDEELSRSLAVIPHGAAIEVLRNDVDDLLRVRYEGRIGYVQQSLITEYNPADGVQPDESACAE